MNSDPFKEYLLATEPEKREKIGIWKAAIGLQAVDGLQTSPYLLELAKQNIDGKISITEVQNLVDNYYQQTPQQDPENRTEEADKVATRITEILSEPAFTFTPNAYISIHRRLFRDIFSHAGQIRHYNITKKEWVLNGETVLYGMASELSETLEYDFRQEKNFSYKNLSTDETIRHLAKFVAGLWQIHAFGEGNTRTTAVFFIKYLRSLGFEADNEIFERNAWYFRNALVRANYHNLQKNIHETTEFLELFLRNVMLKENNELDNRPMHISGLWNSKKVDIEGKKADIQTQKADIGDKKVDIQKVFVGKTADFSVVTIFHIQRMFAEFGTETIFGRTLVAKLLDLQDSSTSKLLKKLLNANIITPVSGYGKGKYRFVAD